MTDYTNKYFQLMSDISSGYENARKHRESEKEQLGKANDLDAIKAWNEREKQFPFPFSRGQIDAYRAWQCSMDNGSSYFEVPDLPWEKDAHDFVTTLKEAGITEFAVTDRSTALMELLHVLVNEEGCKIVGLCTVMRRKAQRQETEEYAGILICL